MDYLKDPAENENEQDNDFSVIRIGTPCTCTGCTGCMGCAGCFGCYGKLFLSFK